MHIQDLYQKIGRTEFDYGLLISSLNDYAQPRNRIQRWLKSGELIRIKKGLYIFGPMVNAQGASKALLAHWIYGPSLISLDFALSYHGLIPERVEAITCITPKRSKEFLTPIGLFYYRHIPLKKYIIGALKVELNPQQSFLMASPEKALSDKLLFLGEKLNTIPALKAYLYEDLRINHNQLALFQLRHLQEIQNSYECSNIDLLCHYLGGI